MPNTLMLRRVGSYRAESRPSNDMTEQPHTGDGLTSGSLLRGVALIVAIAALSSLHYLTSPSRVMLQEIYNYLCYMPIILAAYWYGIWGGVASAALTSTLIAPHIRASWSPDSEYAGYQYAPILAFHLLGLTVGWLAWNQRRVTEHYRDATAFLERANRDLRESQEHLRRADRLSALGEIAAALAHEIRNPLAGLKGALEIVATRAAAGQPSPEFADIGRRELERLDNLVREFLMYARPHDPSPHPTNIRELISRVTMLLKPEADKKGVTLAPPEPIAPAQPQFANVDPEQMTQVLLNIALNAIQASASGGEVRFVVSEEPGWVQVDIVDQGPGIPPQYLAHVFDPFFTTKTKGTGLGLATAQRIVLAHRGTIAALPGSMSGTIFRVRLPTTGAATPE